MNLLQLCERKWCVLIDPMIYSMAERLDRSRAPQTGEAETACPECFSSITYLENRHGNTYPLSPHAPLPNSPASRPKGDDLRRSSATPQAAQLAAPSQNEMRSASGAMYSNVTL